MGIRLGRGVKVGWLDNCPKCGHEKARVTGWSVSPDELWAGDEVVCAKCGHKGEIKTHGDGDNAWVEWGEA